MKNSTLKNARILIVDDKQSNIDLLLGLLEVEGYTNLKSTTDSRETVGLFNKFEPDLILLDLMMPHLTGFQVMDQLKPLIPEYSFMPILVLTADINEETKQRTLSYGAKDFLAKPFDLVEVSLRIKNLLETRNLHKLLQNQNLVLEEKVKERTQELEIAKEKAEASDRLKTAFMNNISHEIRTPLNGILGFGQFMLDPDITMEERQEYWEILNTSSNRLTDTITNYMDISLIVSGNLKVDLKPVEISTILAKNHDYFQQASLKKNLELKKQFPNTLDEYILNTDEELLQKTLSHLIDNAIKFTEKGNIIYGFDQKDHELEFFVKDTGRGIAKESQERIFDYFMQEDISNTRGHEGSGLGLCIAKGITQLLGGKIRLESEKNQGTTVFLTLPLETDIISK